MLRLLHLSDLHLGSKGAWALGDYDKTELIDDRQRLTRHDLLRGSLDALGARMRDAGETLDAIVVSGDVSFQGEEDGFEGLSDLLQLLGDVNPGPGRTLVVPGNHDVAWATPPDSAQRYQHFLKHIREAGYVTPLLEGIDISSDDGRDLGSPHQPLLDLGDALLVPVNSSNYCGTFEGLGSLSEADLALLRGRASSGDGPLDQLLRRFDELRLVDVCKISKGQTEALSTRLFDTDRDGRFRLRIVVLHHQLLPVNVEEELKPYETMVNLGFFREWLANNRAHLVLHGHKHSSDTYLDLPGASPLLAAGEQLGQHFVMVSSTATANREVPSEIARLVEVGSPGRLSRSISILAIPPTYPKLGWVADVFPTVGTAVVSQGQVVSRLRVFEGQSVDAVYHQLLAAFPSDSYAPINDVICRVVDGASGLTMPDGYPVPDGEDAAEWFAETVAWWQNPEPQLRPPQFNHGERIWRAAHNVDQFDLAMKELRRPATSRAVILLVDPQSRQDTLYPALCLVQLRITVGNRLDCVGYFRKQQMRAWWPINIGELAALQRKAVDHLGGLVPGEILTFSAIAIGGSDRPRVAVPRVDRWSQDKPGALWELVLATLSPEHSNRSAALEEWNRLFSDWRPGEVMERDGVPLALRGIDALADAVEICARSFPDPCADSLVSELRDLSIVNHTYFGHDSASIEDDRRQAEYRQWRPVAEHAIDRILDLVNTILRR
jgi:hypothetical protein